MSKPALPAPVQLLCALSKVYFIHNENYGKGKADTNRSKGVESQSLKIMRKYADPYGKWHHCPIPDKYVQLALEMAPNAHTQEAETTLISGYPF